MKKLSSNTRKEASRAVIEGAFGGTGLVLLYVGGVIVSLGIDHSEALQVTIGIILTLIGLSGFMVFAAGMLRDWLR